MDRGTRPCGSRGEWDLHTWGDFKSIAAEGSARNRDGDSRIPVRWAVDRCAQRSLPAL